MKSVTTTPPSFPSLHQTTEKNGHKAVPNILVQAMESNQQQPEPMETKVVKEEDW